MNDHIKGKLSSIPTSLEYISTKINETKLSILVRQNHSEIECVLTLRQHKKDAKTQVLVRNIVDIDYLVVRSGLKRF